MTRRELAIWTRYALHEPSLRRALGAVAVTLLLGVGAAAVWGYQVRSNALSVDAVAALERQIALAEHRAEIERAYVDAKQRLGQLHSLERAPVAVTQAALLGRFKELAARNHVAITGQQYGDAGATKADDRVILELHARAAYPALRQFMAGVQRLPWLVFIREASIERLGNAGKEVNATLRLVVYRGAPKLSTEDRP